MVQNVTLCLLLAIEIILSKIKTIHVLLEIDQKTH